MQIGAVVVIIYFALSHMKAFFSLTKTPLQAGIQPVSSDRATRGTSIPLFSAPSSMMEYYDPSLGVSVSALQPVVTILTAVHHFDSSNHSVMAETALTIKYQSLQNWEWVIVDHTSSRENTALSEFVTNLQDARIRLVPHSAGSRAEALNFAATQSRGLMLYPLDCDDLMGHHTLELLYFSLMANPAASFATGFSRGFGHREYDSTQRLGQPRSLLTDRVDTYAAMVRKADWKLVGGYSSGGGGSGSSGGSGGGASDDMRGWDLSLRLLGAHKWGYTVPEYLFWDRTHRYLLLRCCCCCCSSAHC
jgi:hypothetical protein